MNHRERLLAALNHQEPDRVPLDFGSTRVTGITRGAYEPLLRHLGLAVDEIRTLDKPFGTVLVDEAVTRAFDVDVRGAFLGPPDGFQDVYLDAHTYADEWGVVRSQPPGTLYWDLVKSPLSGEITKTSVLSWKGPDPEDPGRFRGLRERVKAIRDNTDSAIAFSLPTGVVHVTQYLRGFEDWFTDLVLEPRLIGLLMDKVIDLQLATTERALAEVGDLVDVVVIGDDIGHQRGPLCSPETYRQVIKPRQQRFFQFAHDHTPAKLFLHTCGSVYTLLDDLIEIGVDILNPVQVSAAHMGDTARLKREYGGRLVFWGAIDTQAVMPQGTTADVRDEVERRITDLAPGGGYVLTAVHNLQPDVPPENVCAMYEAGHEAGRYPIKAG
jgi:uroporphyrinogen decarboxylase